MRSCSHHGMFLKSRFAVEVRCAMDIADATNPESEAKRRFDSVLLSECHKCSSHVLFDTLAERYA
jgi:hypothetical protein